MLLSHLLPFQTKLENLMTIKNKINKFTIIEVSLVISIILIEFPGKLINIVKIEYA